MEDQEEFHLAFEDIQHIIGDGWGDDSSSSDDSRDHLINNSVNIARGFSNISSPEEEVIRSRGRINKRPSDETKSKDSVLIHLATRKSPRKPKARAVNDIVDDFFKSPTPKKARGTPKKNSKITPIKSSSDYKVNPKKAAFRKRLTLNSGDLRTESNSPSRTNDEKRSSTSPSISNVTLASTE